jgi:hypothetical protein
MRLLLLLAVSLYAAAEHPTMPDARLTPGATDPAVTQATIHKTVCVTGYTAKVRHVPESEKKEVARRYGLDESELSKVEIDHFISLENGGSNEVENLWPQYYATPQQVRSHSYYGAREKDVVETYLHRQLCAEKITLQEDHDLLHDWLNVYKKLKGLDGAVAKHVVFAHPVAFRWGW